MLDSTLRRLIDPPLNRAGRVLAARGITADHVTLSGLGFGLLAALVLALGWPAPLALLPIAASRLADGLDGAIPLAFVIRDPAANAIPGAFLLFSFYINAASFLGFATLAAKRGLETTAQGEKSLYYAAGLLEGSETIAFFAALCLWPGLFAPLSTTFGALCLVTATARILAARKSL